jgi:hypothetical protein
MVGSVKLALFPAVVATDQLLGCCGRDGIVSPAHLGLGHLVSSYLCVRTTTGHYNRRFGEYCAACARGPVGDGECGVVLCSLSLCLLGVGDGRRCECVWLCGVSARVCVCVVVANACDGPATITWVGAPSTAIGISDPTPSSVPCHCLLAGPLLLSAS